VVAPVNQHDTTLLPASLFELADMATVAGFDLYGSYLTLDSGFDSADNKLRIEEQGMIPVIKLNRRRTKDEQKLENLYDSFNETVYKERYKVERTFAWVDTYRKLVIRYEKLECTHNGFKYLAYSMMNLRVLFGNSL